MRTILFLGILLMSAMPAFATDDFETDRDADSRFRVEITYRVIYLDEDGEPERDWYQSKIVYPDVQYPDTVGISKVMAYMSYLLSDLGIVELLFNDPQLGAMMEAFDQKIREKMLAPRPAAAN